MEESVKAKLPNPLPMGLKAPGRPKGDAAKTCVRLLLPLLLVQGTETTAAALRT